MSFAGHSPPTPTTIRREFATGYPGVLPVDSAVVSPPAAIFGKELQIGAFFSGTLTFAIPSIAATHQTTVGPQPLNFSKVANQANATWPTTFQLPPGQSAFVFASVYQVAPATAVLIVPTLTPSWGGMSWTLNGPQTFANLGVTVSVVASSMAGSSPQSVNFIVTALLIGASQ